MKNCELFFCERFFFDNFCPPFVAVFVCMFKKKYKNSKLSFMHLWSLYLKLLWLPLRSRFAFACVVVIHNKCWAVFFEATGGVWWIAVIVKGVQKKIDNTITRPKLLRKKQLFSMNRKKIYIHFINCTFVAFLMGNTFTFTVQQ